MSDSPVPPSEIKSALADSTSSVCGNFISTLLKFPILVYRIFNSWLDADGNFSETFKTSLSNIMLRPGDLIFSASPLDVDGRLLCNGQTVSRTTYAALFAKLGTTYGAGDGTTTFGLPDYRNRFPVGAGDTYALGNTGGEDMHTLTTNEMPSHTHTLPMYHVAGDPVVQGITSGTSFSAAPLTTDSTGSDQAHNNLPPYISCYIYCKT